MKRLILLLCSLALSGVADPAKLTLTRALELARTHSPQLKAAHLETTAAEAAVQASGRWENPQLNLNAEGIGGDLDGFNDTEYEISLKQTFQRGGKRQQDRAVALESVGIVRQAAAEKELELLTEVRLAFIEVMAQQEIGRVRDEQLELGQAFVKVARTRHETGGASELEVVQAELQLEEIVLSQTCCFGDLEAARIHLASLIGIPEKQMGELADDYYHLPTVEPSTMAATHPLLQQMDARIATTFARAQQAGAKDVADITLGAGFKYEAAEEVNTFVFGASVPLNFVRAGRAEKAAILMLADALRAEREEIRRRLEQQVAVIAAVYRGAKMEADLTREKLIPKAEEAYQLCRTGYETGRYSWVELIRSQQHLAEIRVREIEALKAAHLTRAKLYRYMKEGI
jgi:cobalt-zinc-cadmium efflux system outer membrane protein